MEAFDHFSDKRAAMPYARSGAQQLTAFIASQKTTNSQLLFTQSEVCNTFTYIEGDLYCLAWDVTLGSFQLSDRDDRYSN